MHFAIIDDHPLFREALASTVQIAFPGAQVDEADTIAAACDVIGRDATIDMILLDLSLQGVTGFEGLILLRSQFPSVPILVVSGLDDPQIVHEAIQVGAAGFLPKASGKALLTDAITEILDGGVFLPKDYKRRFARAHTSGVTDLLARIATLTPAQMRVLALVRRGKLNKQIAYELKVGESTIKAHISEIMRKLGVVSRTQAVIETAALDFEVIMSGAGANNARQE